MNKGLAVLVLLAIGCNGVTSMSSRDTSTSTGGSVADVSGDAERRGQATALVDRFWNRTWNPPHDIDAVDELMTDDFVITSAGRDIRGRDAFKEWIRAFQARAADLRLEVHETVANVDGTRVVSRWTASAVNRGVFGLPDDGRPFQFTGLALWEVRWTEAGPRLAHNWVERSALEAYQQLSEPAE